MFSSVVHTQPSYGLEVANTTICIIQAAHLHVFLLIFICQRLIRVEERNVPALLSAGVDLIGWAVHVITLWINLCRESVLNKYLPSYLIWWKSEVRTCLRENKHPHKVTLLFSCWSHCDVLVLMTRSFFLNVWLNKCLPYELFPMSWFPELLITAVIFISASVDADIKLLAPPQISLWSWSMCPVESSSITSAKMER